MAEREAGLSRRSPVLLRDGLREPACRRGGPPGRAVTPGTPAHRLAQLPASSFRSRPAPGPAPDLRATCTPCVCCLEDEIVTQVLSLAVGEQALKHGKQLPPRFTVPVISPKARHSGTLGPLTREHGTAELQRPGMTGRSLLGVEPLPEQQGSCASPLTAQGRASSSPSLPHRP